MCSDCERASRVSGKLGVFKQFDRRLLRTLATFAADFLKFQPSLCSGLLEEERQFLTDPSFVSVSEQQLLV